MTWQNFGNLALGNQPLSLFDTLAAQIANTVIVPCTAAGTNAIVLTPTANAPAVPAYTNAQMFAFVPAATTTGSVTIAVGVLTAKNAYWGDGTSQVASGELIIGRPYMAQFIQALNSNAGGFVIFNTDFPTGVTAGAYTSTNLTVDRFGRLSAAATGGGGLAPIADQTVLGNVSGGTATPIALTKTQLTTLVNVFTSGLSGAVPASGGGTTNFLRADGTFAAPSGSSGSGLISIQAFTSTQTITIPGSATKAFITLAGSSGAGGAFGGSGLGGGAGGGGAGALEKYLTGLTSGNTLALTIGAAGVGGAGAGGAGGTSTLASGSQAITTLTANGGGGGAQGATTFPGAAVGGAGGTATNGDVNYTGTDGGSGTFVNETNAWITRGSGGATGLGRGSGGNGSTSGNGSSGVTGTCVIHWFA